MVLAQGVLGRGLAGAVTALVLLGVSGAHADDPYRQAAQAIADAGSQTVRSAFAAGPSEHRVPDGWYLVLSWSVPDPLRRELIAGARRLGATVVVNGLVGSSLNETIAAFRALATPEQAVPIVIDPIRIREWHVETSPTLVLKRDHRYLALSGGEPVDGLLRALALVNRNVRPTSEWLLRHPAPWWDPDRKDPRPLLPEVTASANHRGTRPGWPLVERPLDQALKERIRQVNWKSLTAAAQARLAERIAEGPGLTLPAATKARTRLVDPSARLTKDFSVNGTTLFKTGASMNPLADQNLRFRYLFIDGTDPRQVQLARKLAGAMSDEPPLRVVLLRGNWRQVAHQIKVKHVYWAQAPMLSRWQVERAPSLVTQRGVVLQVEEFPLGPAK
ncbi:MAG: TrbC family F-type conjugative pilus assembly protein [Nitrospirota bacterium]